MRARAAVLSSVLLAPLDAQDPPKVVELSPAHLACDVDAAKTTVITATFDQATAAMLERKDPILERALELLRKKAEK